MNSLFVLAGLRDAEPQRFDYNLIRMNPHRLGGAMPPRRPLPY
jgi:hypothetical protein